MRSTIFFISMLLFVSCSQDMFNVEKSTEEIDTGLLELSKDPASEAIFATMAIQLDSHAGKGGFSKVLGLLNELVHDGKKQLHEIVKTWRGVEARCVVSKIKLAGRQEFFETYLAEATRQNANAVQRMGEIKDNIKGFKKSRGVYSALLKSEIARHHAQNTFLAAKVAHAKAGIASLATAHASVDEWTPKSAALVQTHMHTVSASFLEVNGSKLPEITALLERTTDVKVRGRLLEWLAGVRVQLLAGRQNFQTQLKDVSRFGAELEKALAAMLNSLTKSLTHLKKAIVLTTHAIASSNGAISLYGKLVGENKGLIAANNAYCKNEYKNFHVGQAESKAAIKLFREVRTYFNNHYSKIQSYIKSKYHH
jgi:hypothetical protein